MTRQLEKPGRFKKDILRVGSWNVGGETWDVTADTLRELKSNFDAGKQRGIDCPVVWNHSNDARDRNGCVESLSIEGDSLVCEFSVNDTEDAKKIVNSGGVSVQVREPFFDGLGNEYPLMLTHLGIVNHPVIPGQGPFRELSLSLDKGAKPMRYATRQLKLADGKVKSFTRQLAEGDEAAPDETVSDKAPEAMTEAAETPTLDESQVSALQDPIGKLLKAAYGVDLPAGTNGENFIANLTNTISIAEQITSPEKEEPAAPELDAMPVEQMSPEQLSLALNLSRKREADRKASEEKQRELALQQSKVNYVTKLDGLVKDCKVLATAKASLTKAGEMSGWDLSLLDGFKSPVLNTTSKTRALAGESDGPLTNQQIREAALKANGLLRTTKGTK